MMKNVTQHVHQYHSSVTIHENMQTFEKAITGDNAEKWKQAMKEEIESEQVIHGLQKNYQKTDKL